MPEGDTIFRTATTLNKWILGRQVTAATTKVPGLQLERIVGTTVDVIEPKAKHLLIRFSNTLTLHTHMRMTGSWHVYRAGEKWKKPAFQAKIVIECAERIAVCFNAPVVEMLLPSDERVHAPLNGLGPDVLGLAEFDFDEVARRAGKLAPEYTMGELLLDQRVSSGIGNIYRCESLFMARINPWTPQSAITRPELDDVMAIAIRLMKANVGPSGSRGRAFPLGPKTGNSGSPGLSGGGGPNQPWVYGRTNRPCRVCGAFIKASTIGSQPRNIFWCPRCQPPI